VRGERVQASCYCVDSGNVLVGQIWGREGRGEGPVKCACEDEVIVYA
jgi:hypothetical protein